MPNCFELTRKGEVDASTLNAIDAAMCDHFDAPCDEKQYYMGWYNTIGFGLACGYDWDKCRDVYHDVPELLAVVDWLEEHFTYHAWAEVGRG